MKKGLAALIFLTIALGLGASPPALSQVGPQPATFKNAVRYQKPARVMAELDKLSRRYQDLKADLLKNLDTVLNNKSQNLISKRLTLQQIGATALSNDVNASITLLTYNFCEGLKPLHVAHFQPEERQAVMAYYYAKDARNAFNLEVFEIFYLALEFKKAQEVLTKLMQGGYQGRAIPMLKQARLLALGKKKPEAKALLQSVKSQANTAPAVNWLLPDYVQMMGLTAPNLQIRLDRARAQYETELAKVEKLIQ